jgi:hypothetical protein
LKPAAFSGSYEQDDVEFLLKPVQMQSTDVATRERLVQSGARHYSEVLAPESPPDETYLRLFEMAFERNHRRMAQDIVSVARALALQHPDGLVLVSLARAGTPIGVLLGRSLRRLGIHAPHFSVSIIRDRGIDAVALDTIRARHPGLPIRFIDGWTGKGAIARELDSALSHYNRARGTALVGELVVLADLAGVAALAASGDDYLIPSAILNAVISGLVSRSVLNESVVAPGDFHACVHYIEMAEADRSRWFVDTIDSTAAGLTVPAASWTAADRLDRQTATKTWMTRLMDEWELADLNRIKPGVGEATRAVLRRAPDRILVRNQRHEDVQHLHHLAGVRGVPVEERPDLPYAAVTIIRRLGGKHSAWSVP